MTAESAMKRITIRGIRVFAYHGVLPEEKENGQDFLIDVDMDLNEAARSDDDLSSTVDYTQVAGSVASIAQGRRYNLIETLAGAIADDLVSLVGQSTGVLEVSESMIRPRHHLVRRLTKFWCIILFEQCRRIIDIDANVDVAL